MGIFKIIQKRVEEGLYYLSEHADFEASEESLDIYDVEYAMLHGSIRRTWSREEKYEVIGPSRQGKKIGIVCRLTKTGKVRVITVYEDNP